MAENTDVPESADENITHEITPVEQAGPILVPRLRDRVFSFRSVIAVAAATLLLGGAGGAGLVAATSGDDNHTMRISRPGDGPGGRDGYQQFRGGPGGNDGYGNGPQLQQVPPAPEG